jgi:hypothetical protein
MAANIQMHQMMQKKSYQSSRNGNVLLRMYMRWWMSGNAKVYPMQTYRRTSVGILTISTKKLAYYMFRELIGIAFQFTVTGYFGIDGSLTRDWRPIFFWTVLSESDADVHHNAK